MFACTWSKTFDEKNDRLVENTPNTLGIHSAQLTKPKSIYIFQAHNRFTTWVLWKKRGKSTWIAAMRRFRDTKSIYSVGCIEWKFNSTSIPIWNVYKSKLKAISHNPTAKGIESKEKKISHFFFGSVFFSLRFLGSLQCLFLVQFVDLCFYRAM